ncbi:MAG TPA: glycosyltransferase [Bacteroidales bacterium]|nr:glycosyltransferase [Bacteroidales bacterium]
MIKNRDIIVISLQAWDIDIGSQCKDIATEFSRSNRVLYVNSPLDRMTILRGRKDPKVKKRMEILRGRADDLIPVKENLWTLYPRTVLESIGRIPWKGLFDLGNRINNRRFARQILSAADRLGFTDFILFNDNNVYRGLHLKEMLSPRLSVYYDRDNLLAMDFWKRHAPRVEADLMRRSDLVLANSDFFTRRALQYNPKSFNVGSGCDITLYERGEHLDTPADIASIPRPIIGYMGALITLRLDLSILLRIAREHPEWNLVLIGPEDETFRSSELHRMKNVFFLGGKRPEELPAYLKSFDVAINPQIVNEVTIGNYPRKIDEYLSLGKPVVATRTELMAEFDGSVYLANYAEEYPQLIRRAMAENSPDREEERRKVARSHSWENNIAGIYRRMHDRMEELHAG